MIHNDSQGPPPPFPLRHTVQQIIRRAAYEAGLREALCKANAAVEASQAASGGAPVGEVPAPSEAP